MHVFWLKIFLRYFILSLILFSYSISLFYSNFFSPFILHTFIIFFFKSFSFPFHYYFFLFFDFSPYFFFDKLGTMANVLYYYYYYGFYTQTIDFCILNSLHYGFLIGATSHAPPCTSSWRFLADLNCTPIDSVNQYKLIEANTSLLSLFFLPSNRCFTKCSWETAHALKKSLFFFF